MMFPVLENSYPDERLAWIVAGQGWNAVALFALLFVGARALGLRSQWTIDRNRTQVSFQIRRVPVSSARGSFRGITGTVIWDAQTVLNSSVDVAMPTTSISSNNAMRDADLKTANVSDVEKYPLMAFRSNSVTGRSEHLQVEGNLTLAGATKVATLAVESPTPPRKMGKLIVGFTATGMLRRSGFSFASKYPTMILGDEIRLTIDAEANQ
jgi:polyisoprenoid-binding protein YceI